MKKVREFENARAAAAAQSKVSSSNKGEKLVSDSFQSEDAIVKVPQEKSPKKSPIKVITKSNVKVRFFTVK